MSRTVVFHSLDPGGESLPQACEQYWISTRAESYTIDIVYIVHMVYDACNV